MGGGLGDGGKGGGGRGGNGGNGGVEGKEMEGSLGRLVAHSTRHSPISGTQCNTASLEST